MSAVFFSQSSYQTIRNMVRKCCFYIPRCFSPYVLYCGPKIYYRFIGHKRNPGNKERHSLFFSDLKQLMLTRKLNLTKPMGFVVHLFCTIKREDKI